LAHAVIATPQVPGYVIIGLGIVLLACGVLAIIFRNQIFNNAIRDQARRFGDNFASSRKGTPAAIAGAGVIGLVMGVVVTVAGIVRAAHGL